MINEIMMAYQGNNYLYVMIVFMVVGLLFAKGRRKSFIIPGMVITAVILCPAFYYMWYKVYDYAYWRTLWILPIVPMSAAIPSIALEKQNKEIAKIIIVLLSAVVFVTFGSMVYQNTSTTFKMAPNADKLSDDVVKVAEALLEIEDEPYVVTDASLSQYLRQYSGRIKSLYARDVVYSSSPNTYYAGVVYQNLTEAEGDLSVVAQIMLNHNYDYLVTNNEVKERQAALLDAGFELIKQVNSYGIYRVTGSATEIREYNELHQVTSMTLVDNEGKLFDAEDGYTTIQYIYRDDHYLAYTKCYDADGIPVKRGTYYFHDYLDSVLGKGYVVFISVKDDATGALTKTLREDLRRFGINDSDIKSRGSFYAIISESGTIEESSLESISNRGYIGEYEYSIASAGYDAGNYSSITINGIEYSKNKRGFNVVVFNSDDGSIIDSIGFDTHSDAMQVFK